MKINQLKAGVILSYTTIVMGILVSVIYTPVMIRILGKSEYGLYNLVNSVVSYLGALSFGFSSAYLKFYLEYKSKNQQRKIVNLNTIFVLVYTILALVAVFAGVLLIKNIDFIFGSGLTENEKNTAKILMFFLVINIAISFPASVFEANVAANERYVFQKIIQLLKTVVSPFLALPLLLLGYKSVSLVLASTILTVFSFGINVYYCVKKLKMKFAIKGIDWTIFKPIFIFSSFIFLNIITDQINWSTDKFILGRFGGTDEVAVYSVAGQINTYYLNLSLAISSVFIPRVNQMVVKKEDNSRLLELMIKVGRIQAFVLICVLGGFIILGEYFIKIWAGKGYGFESYLTTLLLIISVTIPSVQNLGIEIQKAKNEHRFRSVIYFMIALCNIVISIPLSIKFGSIGAALGTAICLIGGNGIIMNWYYSKRMGFNMKVFWGKMLKFISVMIIPAIFIFIINRLCTVHSLNTFLGYGIVYVVLYLTLYWKKAANNEEKLIIRKMLSQIKGKVK